MDGDSEVGAAGAAVAGLRAAVDAVSAVDLSVESRDELLALVRGLEVQGRRLGFGRIGVWAELEGRGAPSELLLRGLPDLFAVERSVTWRDAKAEAEAVFRFGPRRAVTGQALGPLFPACAAALADGDIHSGPGGTLSIGQALRLAADAKHLPVVLAGDPERPERPGRPGELGGEVLHHGKGRRLATPAQRTALFARDRGCTFPGCAAPASDSEVHHAPDWVKGGRTDVDTMTISCGRQPIAPLLARASLRCSLTQQPRGDRPRLENPHHGRRRLVDAPALARPRPNTQTQPRPPPRTAHPRARPTTRQRSGARAQGRRRGR